MPNGAELLLGNKEPGKAPVELDLPGNTFLQFLDKKTSSQHTVYAILEGSESEAGEALLQHGTAISLQWFVAKS
jgi:hypothetical protein